MEINPEQKSLTHLGNVILLDDATVLPPLPPDDAHHVTCWLQLSLSLAGSKQIILLFDGFLISLLLVWKQTHVSRINDMVGLHWNYL